MIANLRCDSPYEWDMLNVVHQVSHPPTLIAHPPLPSAAKNRKAFAVIVLQVEFSIVVLIEAVTSSFQNLLSIRTLF